MKLIDTLDFKLILIGLSLCITIQSHTEKASNRLILYNTVLEINEIIDTDHIFSIIEITSRNIKNEQVMLEQSNLSLSDKTILHAIYLDLNEANKINKITLTDIGFKHSSNKHSFYTTHKRRPKHNIIRGKKGNHHKTSYDSTHMKKRKSKHRNSRIIRSSTPNEHATKEDLTLLNLGPVGNLFGLASSKNINDLRSSIKDYNEHMNNIITNTRTTLVDLQKEAVLNHKLSEILSTQVRDMNYFNTHTLRTKIIIDATSNIIQNIKQSIQFNNLGIPNHSIFTNIRHDIESTTKKSGHVPIFDHTNITLINQIEGGFILKKNSTYIKQSISIPLYALDHECKILERHNSTHSFNVLCKNFVTNITTKDCYPIRNIEKQLIHLCYSRPCLLKNHSSIECLELDSNHYIIHTNLPFACRINSIITDEVGKRSIKTDKFQVFSGRKLLFLPNDKELICNELKIDYLHANITFTHNQSLLWDWENISMQNLTSLSQTLPNDTFNIISKHISQKLAQIKTENNIAKQINHSSVVTFWTISNGLSGLALLIITIIIINKMRQRCSCKNKKKNNINLNINQPNHNTSTDSNHIDTNTDNTKKHSILNKIQNIKAHKNRNKNLPKDISTTQETTKADTATSLHNKLQGNTQKNVAIDSIQTNNTVSQIESNKQTQNNDNTSTNSFHMQNIFVLEDDISQTNKSETNDSIAKTLNPYP